MLANKLPMPSLFDVRQNMALYGVLRLGEAWGKGAMLEGAGAQATMTKVGFLSQAGLPLPRSHKSLLDSCLSQGLLGITLKIESCVVVHTCNPSP